MDYITNGSVVKNRKKWQLRSRLSKQVLPKISTMLCARHLHQQLAYAVSGHA